MEIAQSSKSTVNDLFSAPALLPHPISFQGNMLDNF